MISNFDSHEPDNRKIDIAQPFLKWAGGKRQLIPDLLGQLPEEFNKYIEPFVGGGALFFRVRPKTAILSDLNLELINCYKVVRDDVNELINELRTFVNEEDFFYSIRQLDIELMTPIQRAARLIFLNKTSYNGLYRVNKQGKFNVPFGHRVNPTICEPERLIQASIALQGVTLKHSNYFEVLEEFAESGDLVYLDPPYDPVGVYSDFNRYTKEKFSAKDQIALRDEFVRLVQKGCRVILTNANTSFVRDLYQDFDYKIIVTKRNISSKPSTRLGEDLLVFATKPREKTKLGFSKKTTLENFPGTRYMGSKHQVLPFIWSCVKDIKFDSVFDAFSGSGCVSYFFKQKGKTVISNDFMHFSYHIAKSLVENNSEKLDKNDLSILLETNSNSGNFISETFKGLYFSDDENAFLDNLRANIELLTNSYKRSLALAAISRACLKRRARGIFTYTGNRYDDGRRDLRIDLQQHFLENVAEFNNAVFDNGKINRAFNYDIFNLDVKADLVYLDPPYVTPNSDNDYTRRYHFIEGLARQWQGVDILPETKTKKFKRYDTPFLSKELIGHAFETLCDKFKDSILVVSYSSNSIPSKGELIEILKSSRKKISVFQIDHTYSFGNQNTNDNNANKVQEYVFVAQ